MRPIWVDPIDGMIRVIDQRRLPHKLEILKICTPDEMVQAIRHLVVRGAPLIGASGAYGMVLAAKTTAGLAEPDTALTEAARHLISARPTAVNLAWAVDRMLSRILSADSGNDRISLALKEADAILDAEVDNCRKIGNNGFALIQQIHSAKPGQPIQILTHCNAGWLACIEYGTATAPIYAAFDAGIDIHVWVDETRPLNQGARLTSWELGQYGVPHTLITDNAGGHLMQHGMVDMVIVGADRVARSGDAANKIGTYLKALAAWDNHLPFYVAIPSTTFDWTIQNGVQEIPIETRDPDEVRYVDGLYDGRIVQVLVPQACCPVANHAFDVTPARLITGLITERGVCAANEADILRLFPERA
jgi:methylthioribose-1-phosphate isomerase